MAEDARVTAKCYEQLEDITKRIKALTIASANQVGNNSGDDILLSFMYRLYRHFGKYFSHLNHTGNSNCIFRRCMQDKVTLIDSLSVLLTFRTNLPRSPIPIVNLPSELSEAVVAAPKAKSAVRSLGVMKREARWKS